MVSPHVTPIVHAGPSPYAPPLTPAQQHAAVRCAPLTKPPAPQPIVDVWPLEDRAA